MAEDIRTINTLKTQISKRGGLAKPTRFLAQISLPFSIGTNTYTSDLSILCQTAQLPTRQIQTVEYAGTQRHSFSIPSGFSNDTITCTFLVGADFFPKNIFDAWMALSVDTVSYRVRYVEEYSATFNLYQLDQSDNIVYGVELQEAFPITISAIEMNAGSVNEVHKINVTFSYYDAVPLSTAQLYPSTSPAFQGATVSAQNGVIASAAQRAPSNTITFKGSDSSPVATTVNNNAQKVPISRTFVGGGGSFGGAGAGGSW